MRAANGHVVLHEAALTFSEFSQYSYCANVIQKSCHVEEDHFLVLTTDGETYMKFAMSLVRLLRAADEADNLAGDVTRDTPYPPTNFDVIHNIIVFFK